MLYLVQSFAKDKDTSGKGNPPLSEEGVVFGKKLKLRNNALKFDLCYTSFHLSDFSSALIMVGDRLIVERCHELDTKDKDKIIAFVKALPSSKSILLVVNKEVLSIVKDNFECNILI